MFSKKKIIIGITKNIRKLRFQLPQKNLTSDEFGFSYANGNRAPFVSTCFYMPSLLFLSALGEGKSIKALRSQKIYKWYNHSSTPDHHASSNIVWYMNQRFNCFKVVISGSYTAEHAVWDWVIDVSRHDSDLL